MNDWTMDDVQECICGDVYSINQPHCPSCNNNEVVYKTATQTPKKGGMLTAYIPEAIDTPKPKQSALELQFIERWELFEPDNMPTSEYKFHPTRKWRFDFAWIDKMIAVEMEGGVWSRGRHVRPQGFIDDLEKYNAATELGWRLFRYESAKREYLEQLKRVLDWSE